jgi:hypothetical protein
MEASAPSSREIIQALGGFAQRRAWQERCDLCAGAVAAEHPHLLEIESEKILCACDPCAALFSHRPDGRKLIRIPRDARKLEPLALSDTQWASLRLPIDLAFFVYSLRAHRMVAYYPSPAGNTESQLRLTAWEEIEHANPVLASLERGVEALLADRTRGNRRYFIAPIDQCFRLTGVIRTNWRGFSGGEALWKKVDEFFARLEDCAHA